ncbi:MAG: NB-ARC domain-containing protein, partial [Deltaproteobacteria bacterium]|nr:NB-ARC domain-containing protein [Deltaproteobacteria bacterium]
IKLKSGPLLNKIINRVNSDKDEGDIAYFYSLSLEFEYITKLTVLGVLSCLQEDIDRNRYSAEYNLVRSNSIGKWVDVLNSTLTGPASQFFISSTTHIYQDLTKRVKSEDWRYKAFSLLHKVAKILGIKKNIGNKVALRNYFEVGVAIRNRTRGHGAITTEQCTTICPLLKESINLVLENLKLFQHDWAHLHQNLSKKYRVSKLLGKCNDFEYLKSSKSESFCNGVFINIKKIIKVPLLFTKVGIPDIFLPNGKFKGKEFETLSYFSNEVDRRDGTNWSKPPGRLPESHTEGKNSLYILGESFTNLPEAPKGYISRYDIEKQLRDELLRVDGHPIITLTGPGGIGKTTLALEVIKKLTKKNCPYEVILWMSSRDIDLLDTGPKPVTPKVVNKKTISKAVVTLLGPSEEKEKDFDSELYFQNILSKGATGETLIVMDNFETVESPSDIFSWIDTYIRLPNKVLITTRFRDFHADFPIKVGGMKEDEAKKLIMQEVNRLGIEEYMNLEYKKLLIIESDGHPYVMKILLGQVAKNRKAIRPKRIVAGADQILVTLFERTYEALSPPAQRVFLLLSSWRVFVPAIAVEAVALRPENERFDVQSALDELRRFSLTEEVFSTDNQIFVGIPLAAASFGRKKLKASRFKIAVEKDRKLLMCFGAGDKESPRHGVMPRINQLVKKAARNAHDDPKNLEEFIPIFEFLASKISKVNLKIARLFDEINDGKNSKKTIIKYIRRYLESDDTSEREDSWFWLADLYHDINDAVGEVHALGEIVLLQYTTPEKMGSVANRINNSIRELKNRGVEESWSDEVGQMIERVAEKMRKYVDDLDATDCSRLAWLYLNISKEDEAREIAIKGRTKDENNEHCLKLVERLN